MEDVLRGLLHLSLSVVDLERDLRGQITKLQDEVQLAHRNLVTVTGVLNSLIENQNAHSEGDENTKSNEQDVRSEKGEPGLLRND